MTKKKVYTNTDSHRLVKVLQRRDGRHCLKGTRFHLHFLLGLIKQTHWCQTGSDHEITLKQSISHWTVLKLISRPQDC